MKNVVKLPLRIVLGVLTVVSLCAVAPATAQIGVTTDIITGVVTDLQGTPLPGVLIEAQSLETGITRTTTSDGRGRYIILFPDGGGQYSMTASVVGMLTQTATLMRHADEDRLVWNVLMQEAPFALDPLVATAERRPVQVRERPSPGSTQRTFTPEMIANLPIDAEDLTILATLVPGVVGIDATDSTTAAFSVAGQRPDANVMTLDGMTFGSGQIPQEGLRTTRVVTNTFDVSRGRFSGGMMASTTRGGGNAVQASFRYSLRRAGRPDRGAMGNGAGERERGGSLRRSQTTWRRLIPLRASTGEPVLL